MPAPPIRETVVAEEAAGQRLDRFLATWLGASRAEVRRLLGRGGVQLDGVMAGLGEKGDPIATGARVRVSGYRSRSEQRAEPEPGSPLEILAEGAGWLALDKPPGQPVHPLEEAEAGTSLGAVIARHPEIQGVGEGGLRSGVVHRLDVDTSGVLLMATQQARWQALRDAFSCHEVGKRYRAIVLGDFDRPVALEVGLIVAQHRPARVRVVDASRAQTDPDVRLARQKIAPLEALRGATLVEVELETGFLHQVRATLCHLGHPVAGDATYGPGVPADSTGAARQMLHAASLATGEIRAESPDPADFVAVLQRLRS